MSIRHIEDLKVFVQVVDSGKLAAAGRVLGLSPTLVSRRLARLEKSVGIRLLERTTRTLQVTDEGRLFYTRCRHILTELENAVEELNPASQEVSGRVRMVLPTSMLAYGIMDSLNVFLKTHPRLTLELQLSDQSIDLAAGGWDIATHIGAPPDSSHIGRFLGDISPHLAATSEYLAQEGIPETPMDLSQHQCLRMITHKVQEYWPIIDKDNLSQKIPIRGQLICHDIISIYTAMSAGLGIGLIPKAALEKGQKEGLLVEVLPGCRVESNPLYALIPAGRQSVSRIRVLVDWLATFMQTLNG